MAGILPVNFVLEEMLRGWLKEDLGRGDVSSGGLGFQEVRAVWRAKQPGVVAGVAIAPRVFHLLDSSVEVHQSVTEGGMCRAGEVILELGGPLQAILMGERTALNLAMRLSGIATATRQYVEQLADLPTQFVDTRKTTPGLRVLEKYASRLGGALNHRMGLDDAVMLKDNHIAAAGGIAQAIAQARQHKPYPLTIEVETETLLQVQEAVEHRADIIMLDNMSVEDMTTAVQWIRAANSQIKLEASGNVSLETVRAIALTGVDYISSSGPITRAPWLDISMRVI